MTQQPCKLMVVGLPESESELRTALESAEFELSLLETSEQALAHINTHDVDLAIIDTSLPNPVQLCQAIGEATEIPIVLLLTSEDLKDLDTLVEAPIDRFFIKPLVSIEVLANLQAVLRRIVWQKQALDVLDENDVYQSEEIYCCYHTC
ncbi:MAG: response regulator [Caldilineaceae bacterium]|nr:response regulator [Caldilineaceae bacterium]